LDNLNNNRKMTTTMGGGGSYGKTLGVMCIQILRNYTIIMFISF
jgi:hypothetical protein